jgi:hypothetical protein
MLHDLFQHGLDSAASAQAAVLVMPSEAVGKTPENTPYGHHNHHNHQQQQQQHHHPMAAFYDGSFEPTLLQVQPNHPPHQKQTSLTTHSSEAVVTDFQRLAEIYKQYDVHHLVRHRTTLPQLTLPYLLLSHVQD